MGGKGGLDLIKAFFFFFLFQPPPLSPMCIREYGMSGGGNEKILFPPYIFIFVLRRSYKASLSVAKRLKERGGRLAEVEQGWGKRAEVDISPLLPWDGGGGRRRPLPSPKGVGGRGGERRMSH